MTVSIVGIDRHSEVGSRSVPSVTVIRTEEMTPATSFAADLIFAPALIVFDPACLLQMRR